jgi:prepilin-type N-terminal cleavage/methylation domain-containing protein
MEYVGSRMKGFTLIEMAIVLLVITLLLGGLLVPLSAQIEQRKTSETQKLLQEAKEALIGFAISNGRLPCPASATSNGQESFASGGNATNGFCSNYFDGFLPAVALGFTPIDSGGYAVDGWGLVQNRIRYAVANNLSSAFTQTDGMKTQTMTKIAATTPLLYVCTSAPAAALPNTCPPATQLTDQAIFVVYSVGKNAATGGTGADEAINPNPNSPSTATPHRVFVSHEPSAAAGNEFDDIVDWLSPNILFNRMVAAGRLP